MTDGPWFFAPPNAWTDREIVLPDNESHHARKVLRIAVPDVITVTDGAGSVALCAASRVEEGRLVAEILERREHRRPKPNLVIYQGTPKGNKADEIVERLAQLGVAEVWFYESTRTVAKWSGEKVARSTDRWTTLARGAATQSRNAFTLQAGGGLSWTELVRRVAREDLAVVLWEEASLPMRTALTGMTERLALIVGPEGGLAREEADQLADSGALLVSLGPTILRTEVAPVVAASALLYHYGILG